MINKLVYYIAGLFDGEGTVGRKSVSISNTHRPLLELVSNVLTDLNIKHYIYKRKQLPNRLICYTLDIFRKEYLEKFYKLIPFTHKEKQLKLQQVLKNYHQESIYSSQKEAIVKDYESGLSYRKIAKKFGFKNHTIIYNYIKNIRKL